ncbi:uncharacterized protein LOC128735892 [Sabethes cyaneus]|uniref:uncharacterized protein LOC128735892 n=1 Tax=Sabethes cyaneus TaxID=53552 RepID=UPI00237EA2E0|nr:uncharacterized protein LOC128735892 [Sabethes cyaneus]
MPKRKTRQLEQKHINLLASLDRCEEFAERCHPERDRCEIKLRLDNLDEIWATFEEVQTDIESHEEHLQAEAHQMATREKFESKYFRVKGALLAKVPDTPHNANRDANQPPNASHLSGVKLPTITLPEFDGNYDQWLTFHDTFIALIHSSAEISTVQKFHYLRAAVKGEAAQLIESLTISAMNYPVAWQILVDRYSNSYLLKKKHLAAMLDYPKMKRESANALHGLIDSFERHSKVLKQLQEPVDSWSTIMVHLLCARLDDATIKIWEDHASTIPEPNYSTLIEFLQRRTRVLESLSVNTTHSMHSTPPPPQQSPFSFKRPISGKVYTHAASDNRNSNCVACSQSHRLVECPEFPKMPLEKRLDLVNSARLCSNCFHSNHFVKNCLSKFRCKTCKGKHHTIIHPGFAGSNTTSNVTTLTSQEHVVSQHENATPSTSTIVNSATIGFNTFLMTAVVKVVDVYGNEILARAMLDSGSMSNLMSERLAQMLRIKARKADINVHGIGADVVKCSRTVSTEIRSRLTDFAVKLEFLVLRKVTSKQPIGNMCTKTWNIPDSITLADPGFNIRGEVDLILGIQHFFAFFPTSHSLNLGRDLPLLVETVFGWVISGSASLQPHSRIISSNVAAIENLDSLIERFWEVEELTDRKPWSTEEEDCDNLYNDTTTRNEQGRYVVKLPKKPMFERMMGDSKSSALHRFQLLEKRLEKDESLKVAYHDFMNEYINLQHMELVSNDMLDTKKCFYLPHHPVLKASSTTTKLRVVFDGSAKMSSGYSLNDTLQIIVHPDDRPLQQILWRFHPSEPIRTYQLCTVTYGLAPSSFLATKTLLRLTEDEGHQYSRAAPLVSQGYYMDDFIGGDDTVEGAIALRKEMSELMAKGGFILRKWSSNRLAVLDGLPPDQVGTQSTIKFNPGERIKTLGIIWEPETDCLRFDVNIKEKAGPLTKRKIQSCIAQLFDPLGLISPIVVAAKIIMQRLWLIPIGWDDEVTNDLKEIWEEFRAQLNQLSTFTIDRFVLLSDAKSIQLHCFADASKVAYGCCIYARTEDKRGMVKVQLISAKSRVAPLKRLSIPRLELCAAQLASRLYNKVTQALGLEYHSVHFWSDSTVVLNWLQSPPYTWKTFVANRVSEIQTTTRNVGWKHIPGLQNPADMVSRGMRVNDFVQSTLWKNGPNWLCKSEEVWPQETAFEKIPEDIMERETVVAVVSNMERHNSIFTRYSNYNKLIRIVAWLQRFRNNCHLRRIGENLLLAPTLTVKELESSKTQLIKLVQSESYSEEIKALQTGNLVSSRSSIRTLNPFLDEINMLRVGGRLQLSDEPYDTKHPILLPGDHPFTKLLVQRYHHQLLHAGPRLMLAVIREHYWPVNGRRLLRGIARRCYNCTRAQPAPVRQPMGQFPALRVTPSRAFTNTGVDYCGPIYLRSPHRKAFPTKAYISVFVCFSTKAVHLELAGDLSTATFMSALRRFIARRGKPANIFSDNGKNFIGARNELHEIYTRLHTQTELNKIIDECASKGISWHLIPPKAPNFGGLWESAVKIAKQHLYRPLRNSLLSYEDTVTILAQAEACMNSRPLIPLSDDVSDLSALTPGHFLIGCSLHALPDRDLRNIPLNRLNRFQRLQQKTQQFWHMWRNEYLKELQRDSKPFRVRGVPIKVGTMVILRDDSLHPTKWPLARIIEAKPGIDGVIRVVLVQTISGIFRRPVSQICLLPADDQQPLLQQSSAISGETTENEQN